MADRRRRRTRASQDSEDDDESGSGSDSGRSGSPSTKARARDPEPAEVTAGREEPKAGVESECESEDEAGEAVLSDYDSADPEDNGSHSEGAEEEEEGFSEEEAPAAVTGEPEAAADDPSQEEEQEEEKAEDGGGGGGEEEGKGEEKNNAAGERQSGDGQESTEDPETKAGGKPGQQLDDDEDRKNPAYIPRKGLFFEHDVRGHAQEEERPKGRHRKLWKDEGRWEHDRFREEEQAPKSRQELIAIYGYDIRNGAGSGAERAYRQRRPRPAVSPSRDKRWLDGGERPARSWSGGRGLSRGGAPPPAAPSPAAFPPLSAAQRGAPPPRAPPPRSRAPPQAPRGGGASRAGRGGGGRGSALLIEEVGEEQAGADPPPPPRRPSPPADAAPAPREASPASERPVERKSYSLARRTRSRASDLGSKQPSLEEAAGGGASSPGAGGKSWTGGGDGASQPTAPAGGAAPAAGGGALGDLDQDVARLSLARQNWSQSPTSYMRSEMRGLPNPVHLPGGPPQFSSMEELGGSSRAKRYSSQRQRPVPEPAAPPLHLPVMEGHFYETVPYQGPIYTHGDGPAPIPPQSMLVQPEMHLPHPGIHPHQSGAPIASPALYGGPPVSLSPGQPQQLLPPPFYPPPGVMTFPYPTMYPTPQAQAQVTYGGVTYYDTVQQQAQPKPSPPRRTSQPVSVKPPPPEVPFASE